MRHGGAVRGWLAGHDFPLLHVVGVGLVHVRQALAGILLTTATSVMAPASLQLWLLLRHPSTRQLLGYRRRVDLAADVIDLDLL